MKKLNFISFVFLMIFAFYLKSASSQVLLEENFNYTGLLTANGWNAHNTPTPPNSITTATGSLSYTNYYSSGIGNMAIVDTAGEDINKTFAQVDTGSVYVSFLVNVEKAKAAGDYFLHISPTTILTTFRGRVFAKYDSGTDKIAFGIAMFNNTSGIDPVYTAFNYDLNTTYLLVLKYSFRTGADLVSLFVNPAINGIEPTATITHETLESYDLSNVGSVALRQGTAASAAKLKLDGLRIGKTWLDILPFDNSGIFENYIITNNGTNVYDAGTTFDGKDFGDFPSNGTFILKGGQVKTWKNAPPDNITGARMFYRIYEQSSAAGTFTNVNLPFAQNLPNLNDQLWENNTLTTNLLSGLAQGDYYFEVYFEADYTSNSVPGIHVDNNDGDNYKAAFTVVAPLANSGIFERYIVTNTGSDIYTEGVPYNTSNLGSFQSTDVFILKGGQVKTWKNIPQDNITGARMFYRIYEQTATPPSFTSVNLPWSEDLLTNNDQLWENIAANVHILNALPAGNYYLEVYFEADYTSNSVPGIHVDNNSGSNYKASFTVLGPPCAVYNIPFSQGFNDSDIPTCWTQIQEGGTTINWTFVTTATNPSAPFEGTHFARLSSTSTSDNKVKLVSPEINLTGATLPYVKFRHFMKDWTGDQDELRVYYRTSSASPWMLLAEYTSDVPVWTERKLTLPNPSATYQIAFEGNALFGYGIAIDQVVVDVPPANDMAMVEWVSPQSGCGLTSTETIIVKVANLGTQPQSNVPIVASIDGGFTPIGPEILPGIIQPGDTIIYEFVNKANMSVPGVYYSGALVLLTNDEDNTNDTVVTTVYASPLVSTFPYVQNFDNYSGWSPGIISGTQQWELGLPAQTQLNGDYSGTMQNAWMTKLSANYDTDANVYLLSPCLDFTNLSMPMFSVFLNLKTEADYDAMVLESSTDGGLTWDKVVGDAGFYNNTSTSGLVAPPKWSGSNGGWTKYETSIPYLAGEPDVKLRFRFQSDDVFNDEGVAIDEIRIYEPVANDVGVFAVFSPVNSLCGNTTDTLKLVVTNYGFLDQDTIPVKIKVNTPDNILNLTDTLFTDIAFNEKDTLITFVINTLTPGTYTVTANTALTGDSDQSNDTIVYTFTVSLPQPVPYVQDFEGTFTDWMGSNVAVDTDHGSLSNVLYTNLWSSAPTAIAQSPKLGPITTGDFMMFDYRIVDYDFVGPWPATVLEPGDTIFVMISTDCADTFESIDTICNTNHNTADTMITKQYNLDTYVGETIIVRFDMQSQPLGDYYIDIDNFIIGGLPVVDLGNDTSICDGSSITLDAENATPYTTYAWTSNPPGFTSTLQNPTVSPTACTEYIVVVDNGFGMTASDAIVVCVNPTPALDLGPDMQMCSSSSLTIDAGLDISTIFFEGLRGVLPTNWTMNNEAGQVIEQTTAGGYLLLDDAGDWVVSETYDLTGLPLVKLYVDIASYGTGEHNLIIIEVSSDNGTTWNTQQFPIVTDTTTGTTYVTQGPYNVTATGSQIKFRFKRPAATGRGVRFRDLRITSSAPYAHYNWSTGETTQTIDVNTQGCYSVTVTNTYGCTDADTICVSFFNVPVIDFGLDTAICTGDVLVLDAGTGFETYEWQDGSDLQTFSVTTAGTFWVVAEDINGCISSDTISVIINPSPVVSLGGDTNICANQPYILDAGAGINYSYEWKEISSPTVIGTSQTLSVNTAGTYIVIVDNGCTNTATDTATIGIKPIPTVDLGQDMIVCPQTTVNLSAGLHDAYLWSTGADSAQIAIILPDIYWVVVTGPNLCTNSDTIVVDNYPASTVNLGNDTTICVYDNLLLDAGAGFTQYTWFDSSTNQMLLIEGAVQGIGTVNASVVVIDNNGCEATDTRVITVDACTGLDSELTDNIEIYPNPSNGKVFVELNDLFNNGCDLFIYNVQGQVVYSENIINTANKTVELNLNKYGKGVYFLKLVSGNDLTINKLIIN